MIYLLILIILKKIASNFKKYKFDCIYMEDMNSLILKKKKFKSFQPLKFKKRHLVTLGMPFCQHSFFWNKKIFFKNKI